MGTKSQRRARGRAFSEDEEVVQDVEPQVDDAGFAEVAVTGANVSGEFRCVECGYGAVVRRGLPPCPMCGGTVWESSVSRSLD